MPTARQGASSAAFSLIAADLAALPRVAAPVTVMSRHADLTASAMVKTRRTRPNEKNFANHSGPSATFEIARKEMCDSAPGASLRRAQGSCPKGFGRYPQVTPLSFAPKSTGASATLPPQSRHRRLGGVMSTPQLAISDSNQNKNGDNARREHSSSTCCECICGRQFQISVLDWICPNCQAGDCDRGSVSELLTSMRRPHIAPSRLTDHSAKSAGRLQQKTGELVF
jgi:hypothetical protein